MLNINSDFDSFKSVGKLNKIHWLEILENAKCFNLFLLLLLLLLVVIAIDICNFVAGHVERNRRWLPDPEHFYERPRRNSTSFQKFPTAPSQGLHHEKRFQVFKINCLFAKRWRPSGLRHLYKLCLELKVMSLNPDPPS